MATSISTIYDALVSLLSSKLTGYIQLPNPYAPEENNELYLNKGFGVAFADGENTQRFVGCKLSVARTFNIILVNRIVTTDHNTTVRGSLEKSIMEDEFTIINELEKNPTLQGSAFKSLFVSDNGIEYLEGERMKYLFLVFNINIEYLENFT